MAGRSAEIVIRLRDLASAGAKQIAAALKQVGTAARGINGTTVRGPRVVGSLGERGTLAALGGARTVLGAAGLYGLGRSATAGFKDHADVERRLSRIMITADATRAEMNGVLGDLVKLSNEVALPLDKVVGGLDTLVAQGRTLRNSLDFLPAVVRSAQASGAEVVDIAKTADAVGTHLKVSAKEMQTAFDIMQAGGKAGQFELKDMARFLPSILPAVRAIGIEGNEGLTQVVAMLQVLRKGAGTSEEAATNMENVLQKMQSAETLKKFEKMGVDLEKVLERARREGKNVLDVFGDQIWSTLGGDLSKLNKLFEDAQVQKGVRAWMMGRQELRRLRAEIGRSAAGATMRDLANVTNDAAAAVQRLSNGWGTFWRGAGRAADSAGLSKFLAGLGAALDEVSNKIENAPWTDRFREANRKKTEEWDAELSGIKADQLDDRIKKTEAAERRAEQLRREGRISAETAKRVSDELAALRLQREEARLAAHNEKNRAQTTITAEDVAYAKREAIVRKMVDRLPLRNDQQAEASRRERATQQWLWDRRSGRKGPSVKGAPPAVDLGDAPAKLDQITQRAGQAQQALQKVDNATVAPQVDTSALEKLKSIADQALSALGRLGGMTVSPTIAPRIAPASGGAAGTLNDFPGRR